MRRAGSVPGRLRERIFAAASSPAASSPGADPTTATRTATLVITTIRGLLLDLLATGGTDRVQDAAETFLATLDQSFYLPAPVREVKRDDRMSR